jgi:single-strand DNA-binding protein
MSKFNKVFLMGNLTRDPELKYTPSGTAVVGFGIAINRTWKGADGEKKEDVCYVDINMFGRRAEVIEQYFKKGHPIFIDGRLQFQQWETQDGQKRNALKVVAESFEFIGGKGDSGAPAASAGSQEPSFPGAHNEVPEEEIPF